MKKSEAEKQLKFDAKKSKQKEQNVRTEMYLRCKMKCSCGEDICVASGFKQCTECNDVMKSQCSKSKCKVNSSKPTMIPVSYDDLKIKRKRTCLDSDQPTCSRYLEEKSYETEKDDEDFYFEQYYLS